MVKEIIIRDIKSEEKEIDMEFFQSALGTVFYTVVIFGAGALIGTPLWNWVKSKLPWG